MSDEIKSRFGKLFQVASLLIESGEQGCSIYDIMKVLGAESRSSAFVMLENLENMGLAIAETKRPLDRKIYYSVEESSAARWKHDLIASALSKDDIRFVKFILESVSSNTPLIRISGDDFLSRLRLALSPDETERLSPHFRTSGSYFKIGPEFFDCLLRLLQASEEQLKCEVTYRKGMSGEVSTYYIYPLRVVTLEGSIYAQVILDSGNVILLALSRIQNLKVLTHSDYPKALSDPDETFSDPFPFFHENKVFDILVAVSRQQGWYESQKAWPESVSFTQESDGSYLFRLRSASAVGVMKWVLSMAGEAEILEPQSLRELMKGRLERMVEVYNREDEN